MIRNTVEIMAPLAVVWMVDDLVCSGLVKLSLFWEIPPLLIFSRFLSCFAFAQKLSSMSNMFSSFPRIKNLKKYCW